MKKLLLLALLSMPTFADTHINYDFTRISMPAFADTHIHYDFTLWNDNFKIIDSTIECGKDSTKPAEVTKVLVNPTIGSIPLGGFIPPNELYYCWGYFSIEAKNPPGVFMGGPYYAGRVEKIYTPGGIANPMPPVNLNGLN